MIRRKSLWKFFTLGFIAVSLLFASCANNASPETPQGNSKPAAITAKTNTPFVPAENSVDMAKAMKIGWNLGNTFDAHGTKGVGCENAWGQPTTTKAMLHGIKQAGFVSIRIPVSWHDHITESTNYTIETDWLNRVKEVVDWALDEGLCVIINIHHDNLTDAALKNTNYGFAVSKDTNLQAKSEKYIKGVWKNVAEAFKDYNHSLVFELLNEPRDVGSANWGEGCEWYVGGANATEANGIIGKYEQAALDVIRATGSKNADRFIMAPPYAASTSCMEGFKIPTDSASAKNRIMIEAHAYSPYNFAMKSPGDIKFTSSRKNELSGMFNTLYNNYVSKGIGVVIDETGATNKNNDSDRIEWAKYFFGEAYKKGISSFWWDNGNYIVIGTDYDEHYGYYNRRSQVWYFPEVMKASLSAVGIEFADGISGDNGTGNPDNTGTENTEQENTDTPDNTSTDTPKEDLVILEDKSYITNGYSNFALDSAVDLSGYKYLKSEVQLITAEDADKKQILLQFFNSAWKSIGNATTISVSDTIYTEIPEPEEGPRDLMHIQPVVQDRSNDYAALDNIQIKIKKITATNTKE